MNSAANEAFSRWCAERPAPGEINAWLARCPEPTMMLRQPTPPPQPEPRNEYKALRNEIMELRTELRELRGELAAVASSAAENLNAALTQAATETGVLVGEVHADVDRLRKRVADIEDNKPKR
jgi:polyhydroxyalkanoate synthesis regulator phasin